MRQLSPRTFALIAAAVVLLALPALSAALPVADYSQPAARDTEPVILTGKDFPDWSARSNVTAKAPLTDLPESGQCAVQDETCDTHNNYAEPEVDSQDVAPQSGLDVGRLIGYRWNGSRFEQIPFQVDEMFTRYLDNSASGFAFYSGEDQHTTYAFDREGFRFTEEDPQNPCIARPAGGQETTPDPVSGLDDNDELVFMADDAGTAAPADAPLPKGVEELRQVRITDPTDPTSVRIAYVGKAAAENGAKPAFDASNGYVHYQRDASAGYFEKSQSSYDGYGNATTGVVCDEQGRVLDKQGHVLADPNDETRQIARHRPRDYATITTDRYRFRYDGRWLMTDLRISPDGGETYGPDLIDRWKARAFQQDPSSETPCCGYEEEDTNWGGSSTLLGERVGPVRAIRETWGADSGTNVIRRETFYRDEIRQKNYLRVHVIPPLDGIYAQWDFNAGEMTRYYNSAMTASKPDGNGVPIDGHNDEVFGNLDDPCNRTYDQNDTGDITEQYRTLYSALPGLCSQYLPDMACQPAQQVTNPINDFIDNDPTGQVPRAPDPCGSFPYHQSIDLPDPTIGEANSGLQWNVTSGPNGSIVDRYEIDEVTDQSAGGTAQTVFAVPYYRDDACFDDGTGTNPGRKMHLRSSDEPQTYTAPDGTTKPRECWDGQSEDIGSDRYFQGSIGTHGLHILMIADSDNARQTVPVTELVAQQRMVMLTGPRDGSVGEKYGRGFEKALVAVVAPEDHPANEAPEASFGYTPAAPHTGDEVSFDSTSTDAEDAPEELTLDWDLDGDGEFDDASGDTATQKFTTPGDHTVSLRATDTNGDSDEESQTVTVTNPPPSATISYTPAEPLAGDEVTLTATAQDENGSVTAYAWNLDDDGQFDDGSTPEVKHTFTTAGDHRVTVRVTDDEGATSDSSQVVTVGATPPPDSGGGDDGTGGDAGSDGGSQETPTTGTDTPAGQGETPAGQTETPPAGTDTPVESARPAPDGSPPVATVASLPTRLVRVTRQGVALVRVRCVSSPSGGCAGRLQLERRVLRSDGSRRVVRLGRTQVALDAGASRLVKVRLAHRARKLLRTHRTLSARAVLTIAAEGGGVRTSRRVQLHRRSARRTVPL